VFCNFREARGAGGPPKDDTDIFSERHDPNALKVKFAYLCWVNMIFVVVFKWIYT
jgi:hypothetical protein